MDVKPKGIFRRLVDMAVSEIERRSRPPEQAAEPTTPGDVSRSVSKALVPPAAALPTQAPAGHEAPSSASPVISPPAREASAPRKRRSSVPGPAEGPVSARPEPAPAPTSLPGASSALESGGSPRNEEPAPVNSPRATPSIVSRASPSDVLDVRATQGGLRVQWDVSSQLPGARTLADARARLVLRTITFSIAGTLVHRDVEETLIEERGERALARPDGPRAIVAVGLSSEDAFCSLAHVDL
jgi:hypothetical protein